MLVKLLIGLAILASASAASVSATASLDGSSIALGGRFVFPGIPGINRPLFGFPPIFRRPPGNGGANLRNIVPGANLIPGIDDVLSRLGILGNSSSNISLPAFPELFNLSLPFCPGLDRALQEAREHLSAALNITSDLTTGLHDAVEAALVNGDPVASVQAIFTAISKAYVTVALHCPLFIVGPRVLQEGIRLAGEVLRSIQNILNGYTTSTTSTTSTTTSTTTTTTTVAP